MEDKLFTLDEVVEYLNISKSTLYKLSQRKELPSVKIGKQLRFRKSSLDIWLAKKEGRDLKPKHLLLVEDDKLVLKSIGRLLNTHGYLIDTAENADEALEKVKKNTFDLIISDVRMPGMDGIEAIKRIREFNYGLKRPVLPEIVITGYLDTEAQQRADNLGIKDYIHKPFSTEDFLKVVESKLH